jgi:hypothetical protein
MATIGTTVTLLDMAKRKDPGGKIAKVVELLSQKNEILEDMRWMPGNLETGHKSTIRTGLPAATWRKMNYGVASSKSVTAQVTDTCGMLEAYATVDKALADLNDNTSEFRLSEDASFLEAMNQEMAKTLFYGNTDVNPERFMGLSPRFAASSTDPTQIGYNVIKGGGSGNTNTSIWLVVWGDNTAHGIVPKGSQAGFQHKDLGEQTVYDASNNPFQAYRTHYKWDSGLVVKDWRYIVRVCNVDVAALTKGAATGDDIIDLMTQALERAWDLTSGTPVFYANRTIRSFLRRQTVNKVAQSTLSMEEVAGKRVIMFGEAPVRRVDQILSTEATLS